MAKIPSETSKQEWLRVWESVQEVREETDDGKDIVIIGGVAVFLHTEGAKELPVEYTHDADMAIGISALSDLREKYDMVSNRRLGKRQIIVGDTEVDLYVSNQNNLRVDYNELALAAVEIRDVRVADLQHLLALKLDATRDRWRSAHGAKDRRDVAKLLVMLHAVEPTLMLEMADPDDIELLARVMKSSAFTEIADRNASVASQLRKRASWFVDELTAKYDAAHEDD